MDPFAKIPAARPEAVASAAKLYTQLETKYPDLVKDFKHKYGAWKKTWSHHISPNSADRATGPDFDALVTLGPKIVPLVVYQLTKPQEFMAVQLCVTTYTIEMYLNSS